MGRPLTRRRPAAAGILLALSLVLTACAGGSGGGSAAATRRTQTITLYTCINDQAIQPVLTAFRQAHPETKVALFRAPTGQLNARVAADARSGGVRADVIWACDPLTQHSFATQGIVGGWTPGDADAIPAGYRTADYVGAALLYVVAVHHTGVPAPQAWSDLTDASYAGKVALPDPAVAASALAAVGFFANDPDYGMPFFSGLKKNGAVQESTPDDVTTGVAQGRFMAGITIASSAYAAKTAGSPVDVDWPQPGAIAVYEPVALVRTSRHADAAEQFISFVISHDGQKALAGGGSYPTLPGVTGPPVPAHAPVVQPDWTAIQAGKDRILAEYQRAFGG